MDKVKDILNTAGCIEVSGAEIGPVDNKGVTYENERHLLAKIWCGTKSSIKFLKF